uniref:Reverse transcriptase domain-containing protein n=1 Tax=Tanacetum cinerariifolium TaxID=118510 RepID=A0A699IT20_TANCI|nr:hypothetical protein [Tanacetum cinerariifolium]
MQTKSSSRLASDQSSNPTPSTNPKGRNRRRSKQQIENYNLEEQSHPIVTKTDNRTMAEMLRAPTEGYAKAIVVPPIVAEQFELKHSLINMMTTNQFFGLEKDNPHDHIRWGSPPVAKKRTPRVRFTLGRILSQNLSMNSLPHQEQQTFVMKSQIFNKDLMNLFTRLKIDEKISFVLVEILLERKIAKLTHAVNQQTNVVTTAMTAILKQFQATPPPAPIKDVEKTCVTCGGAHPYYQCLAASGNTFSEFRDNIQGYVSTAAVNYNQGNLGYRPPAPQNQNVHLNELEKVRRMNEANMKAMQTQIDMVKNKLRNEMKSSIQTSLFNQTNEIKNMMVSLLQINITSTSGSGSLPSNTVANPNGELKAITTRNGLVIDGPTVFTPSRSINLEVDECVEETFTDPDLAEDPLHSNNPYSSRMLKQKQQEKDEVQIHKFWQMFKQLHINITLADALILMPKYQKMLKALMSNKEKVQELANTPLNENCSAIILKKLPKKLRDPGKFLISCGFSELKCKALADLANHAICTPAGIARDVFVSVGKFTFPANFVIVDYESDPRVPLILGRPFLRTARALIDVHGEEMILRDDDERLTLNMKHDTSSYSNQPQKESINLINVFNNSNEDFLEDLFPYQPSGNPIFLLHPELTSPEVNNDIFDLEGYNILSDKLLDLDSTKDLHPPLNDNPLSGSTTYFSNPLLEEFADELPPEYDDNL